MAKYQHVAARRSASSIMRWRRENISGSRYRKSDIGKSQHGISIA